MIFRFTAEGFGSPFPTVTSRGNKPRERFLLEGGVQILNVEGISSYTALSVYHSRVLWLLTRNVCTSAANYSAGVASSLEECRFCRKKQHVSTCIVSMFRNFSFSELNSMGVMLRSQYSSDFQKANSKNYFAQNQLAGRQVAKWAPSLRLSWPCIN